MSVSIRVDTSDYDRKIGLVRAGIDEFLPMIITEGTPLIQQEMANQVPVKTGRLRASISSELGQNESETSTNTGYGLYVDQPTQPHIIYPRIAKFLRFQIDGIWIRASSVNHPGTKGNFFIQRTVDVIMPQLHDLAKSIWSSLVNK